MADRVPCASELVAQVRALETNLQALKELMDERDKRYEQRAQDQDRAVTSALTTSKEAVGKAEAAVERRLEGLNELRAMALDQAKTFAREDKVAMRFETVTTQRDIVRDTLDKRISNLERIAANTSGRNTGIGLTWSVIIVAGGALVSIISIVVAIVAVVKLH